jgi:hypothetical protein
MADNIKIEALTHRCAACGQRMGDTHLVTSAYFKSDIRHFNKQVELGIIGADIRALWVHFDCKKPKISDWNMTPDIHVCIRCTKPLANKDIIQAVFQVIDNQAVNPSDPTDVGIALNERIYFIHCDCQNPTLNKQSSNILIMP